MTCRNVRSWHIPAIYPADRQTPSVNLSHSLGTDMKRRSRRAIDRVSRLQAHRASLRMERSSALYYTQHIPGLPLHGTMAETLTPGGWPPANGSPIFLGERLVNQGSRTAPWPTW